MPKISDYELAGVTGGIFQYTSDWGVNRNLQQAARGMVDAHRNGRNMLRGGASALYGDIGRQALGIPRWQPEAQPAPSAAGRPQK